MKFRRGLWIAIVLSTAFTTGCPINGPQNPTNPDNPGSPSPTPTPTPTPTNGPVGPVNLTAAWANDGGDKVTQNELRATTSALAVQNKVWDGTTINVFGAKNEVIAFNLVLEAASTTASNVSVQFNTLTGPSGATIASAARTASGLFDWTQENIELFFVRYLPIKGVSLLSYETYDERHIPKRFRRPWTGAGAGTGLWTDRPDHDKYYPDIAVPLELVPTFNVAAGQNQSVWSDIYIPKTAQTGVYTGTVTVSEGTNTSYAIPVQLTVHGFTLPDVPNSKTMVNFGYSDIGTRYAGVSYPNPGTSQDTTVKLVRDRHFLMAHRHKISLIDGDPSSSQGAQDSPHTEWIKRLDGTLFTAANGYNGPGVGVSNGVYSIGQYGSWTWQAQGQAGMQTHTNNWQGWFSTNFPSVEHFLYLIDESTNYAQTEQWANWITTNPGAGKTLKSFATGPLPSFETSVADLSVSASWFTVGDTTTWANAYSAVKALGKEVFMYNGKRPSNGSFATDDDGVALRELAWAQYKKGIDRWYFWESTYYNDYQSGRGQNNLFHNAVTFGIASTTDAVLGETGWNHSNGDGLLFYPGTDTLYPADSYGIQGPIASIRLKLWRRGIQDVDYVTMAAAINPAATQTIVNNMVPKALWDYGVDNLADPTYVHTDISWSINPDDWETARAQLASIIETGH